MNCKRASEIMIREGASQALLEHISSCPACAAKWHFIEDAEKISLPDTEHLKVSDNFADAVLYRWDMENSQSGTSLSLFSRIVSYAAVAMIGLFLGVFLGSHANVTSEGNGSAQNSTLQQFRDIHYLNPVDPKDVFTLIR